MFIAVASKSGTNIDQHFGHAERFHIYKYRSAGSEWVRTVEVDKYCSFDPDHPFRHTQFDGIVEALDGCRAVVVAMIGELPRQELQKIGITPVVTTGAIDTALKLAHDSVCGGGCKTGATPADCSHNRVLELIFNRHGTRRHNDVPSSYPKAMKPGSINEIPGFFI